MRALRAGLGPTLAAATIFDAMVAQRGHSATRLDKYGFGRTPLRIFGACT